MVTRQREVRPTPRDSMEMEANREINEEANCEIGLRGSVAWTPRGPPPASQAAQMQLSQTTKAPTSGPLPRSATASASAPEISNLRPSTYVAVVARGVPRGKDTSKGGRLPAQGRPKLGRPVDPMREGRCLRCLTRGHTVRECREPMQCRLCRQVGHRQTSCPQQQTPRPDLAGSGLFACLVGELHDADPPWEQYSGKHLIYMPRLDQPKLLQTCVGSSLSLGVFRRRTAGGFTVALRSYLKEARFHGVALITPTVLSLGRELPRTWKFEGSLSGTANIDNLR